MATALILAYLITMSHGRRELDLPTYILLHSSSLENDAMWDVPVCSDFL